MSIVELPSMSKTIEYLASESISVFWNRIGYFCMLSRGEGVRRKERREKRKKRKTMKGNHN